MGRFVAEDPIFKKNVNTPYFSRGMLFKPHRLNAYGYCSNNPINKIDPSGLSDKKCPWWDITSWNPTNYCGWLKSGPGEPAGKPGSTLSKIDKCCKDHDNRLKKSGKPWCKIWDKDVADANKKLNKCISDAIL